MLLLFTAACESGAPTAVDEQEPVVANGDVIPGKYIVVLDEAVAGKQAALREMTAKPGVESEQMYSSAVSGFAGTLTEQAKSELEKDPRIKYIEPDRVVQFAPPCGTPNGGPCDGGGDDGGDGGSEVTPWGITRVNGGVDGTGLTAWVIDSGVDLDHPDLNVDASRSATFITKGKDSKSADDGNGHGSHVAGTIGAIAGNGTDVVGVAPNATIVGVKVLDSRGSGSYSAVIAGVDYVAANASPGDVANMSLGGPTSNALDDAVKNAASNGILFALAAGNDGSDANGSSPARVNHPNVYTVSAFAEGDSWASFSNYGNPPVDYSAPGVSILSTYKNGGTATLNGTSMASPHVAGLLLLNGGNLATGGNVSGDPDGTADPIAVN